MSQLNYLGVITLKYYFVAVTLLPLVMSNSSTFSLNSYPVNLQPFSCKHVYLIRMENSTDPGHMFSPGASCSRSTVCVLKIWVQQEWVYVKT